MRNRLVLSVLALGVLCTACGEQELNFGEPLGLRQPPPDIDGACALPPDPARQCPGPSWDNVYDLLVQPKYGCANTAGGCHGKAGQTAPYFPCSGDDPVCQDQKNLPVVPNARGIAKAELEAYTAAGTDLTYIGAADSYMICNIWQLAPTKVGLPMPLVGNGTQIIEGQDLLDISNWFFCEYGGGAGGNGTGGGGAGGGAGGAGTGGAASGTGGAGGAGGN